MRLSISLDPDLYAVARALGKAEDCSLSTAINRLVRRAMERPGPQRQSRGKALSSFPTSAGDRLITGEDVAALEDER